MLNFREDKMVVGGFLIIVALLILFFSIWTPGLAWFALAPGIPGVGIFIVGKRAP